MIDELLSQDEINALLSGAEIGETPAPGGGGGAFTPEQGSILEDLAAILSSSAESVYGMLAGKEVTAFVQEKEVLPQSEFSAKPEETPFVFRVICGGLKDAPMAIIITEKGALTLADLMMGGEGKDLPEEAGELYLNAAQEGLSQVIGAAFSGMSGMLAGKRIMPENIASTLESDEWLPFPTRSPEEEVWAVGTVISIEGLGDFPLWALLPLSTAKELADEAYEIIGGSKAAAGAVEASSRGAPPKAPAAAGPAREPAMETPSFGKVPEQASVDVRPAEFVPLIQRAEGSYGSSKIDLIADIPVRVTVELGRTRKNISDILNMTAGSVIELDKMAGEPVDILVNGKLVAKGEVVVIDENFGVRITEIVTSAGRVHSV